MKSTTPPRGWGQTWSLRGSGFAVLYLAILFAERALSARTSGSLALCLPAGLLVGMFLRRPPAEWLVYFGISALVEWGLGLGWGQHATRGWADFLGNGFEAFAAACLVRRWGPTPLRLDSVRGAAAFLGGAAVVAPAVAASVNGLLEPPGVGGFWSSWFQWWSADSAGIVVVAPLVLSAEAGWGRAERWGASRWVEAGVTWGGFAAYTWLVIHLNARHGVGLKFSLIPLAGWVALRFGIRGAMMASLLVGIVASAETSRVLRAGLEPAGGSLYAVVMIHAFVAVTGASAILLAAMWAERRRAEEQIALSLSQLQSTIDSSADGLLVVDLVGRITVYNQRFLNLWRVPTKLIEGRDDQAVLAHVLDQLVDPQGFLQGVAALYGKPEAEYFDTLNFRDGRVFERYSRPQRLADRVVGRVWSFRDVTDRLAAERAGEAEARRRRTLFENSHDGIVVIDPNQAVVEANPRFAAMLGYSPEEVRGLHVWDWDARWTREELEARSWERDERPTHFETRHRRKDGSVFDVEVSIVARDWDQEPYAVCVCRDITERTRAVAQVAGLKRFYEAILENVQDGIWVAGADHRITYTNRGMTSIAGVGLDQIVGRDVTAEFRPETTGEFLVHYWRAVESLLPRAYEARVTTPAGRRTWQTGWLVPILEGRSFAGMICTIQDQTERIEAAQALRDRETQYRAVVETSADGFMVLDRTGRILEVNEAYIQRSGFTREALLDRRITDLEVAAEPGPGEFLQRMEGIAERGSDLFECDHRSRDGTPWRAEVDASYGAIGEGRWFVFVRDVRRRHRLEALLRARLRLSELNQDQGIDVLLQAALDEAELFTESRIGFFHFVHEDQENLSLQAWSTQTLQKSCKAVGKGRHYAISEAGIWVDCIRKRRPVVHNDYAMAENKRGLPEGHAQLVRQATVPVVRGERVVAVMGVGNKAADYTPEDVEVLESLASMAMDLVAQKQAEQALRESEELYRTLVAASPDAITVADLEGRIVYASPRALELFETESPEATRGHSVLEWVVPEDQERAARSIQKLLTEGRMADRQYDLCRKSGTRFHADVSADVVRAADGSPRLLVVITRDVTERKQLEDQLRQAQKMEAVGQLAGGVAHDFNNILTSMLLRLDLLRGTCPPDAEVVSGLAELESEAQRAAGLIRQLLLFSRRSVLQRRPLDLNELVDNLLRMLRRLLGEHIELCFHARAGLSTVEADAGMLEQVILNLAVNARDAMPKGGRLTLSTEWVEITPETARQHPERSAGRWVCLSVTDTGCGIEPAHLAHIFEPFFTTKEVGKGTGLGLATVYGIVQQHRGWVEVSSRVGEGSQFRIALPPARVPVGEPARPRLASPPKPRGGSECILLVEDEPLVRKTVADFLRRLGYEILEAANGKEALTVWQVHRAKIALLFTDMMMPEGLTGLDLVERLRAEVPRLKVLLSSGYSADLVSQGGPAEAGIVYMPKPSPPSELARAIRGILDGPLAPTETVVDSA